MSTQLSDLISVGKAQGLEPKPPFPGTVRLADGTLVVKATVTALLLRTVVWHNGDITNRHQAHIDAVAVEVERLRWKLADGSRETDTGQPDRARESRLRSHKAVGVGYRRCPLCGETKAKSQFNATGSYCKPCYKAYAKERRLAAK